MVKHTAILIRRTHVLHLAVPTTVDQITQHSQRLALRQLHDQAVKLLLVGSLVDHQHRALAAIPHLLRLPVRAEILRLQEVQQRQVAALQEVQQRLAEALQEARQHQAVALQEARQRQVAAAHHREVRRQVAAALAARTNSKGSI